MRPIAVYYVDGTLVAKTMKSPVAWSNVTTKSITGAPPFEAPKFQVKLIDVADLA